MPNDWNPPNARRAFRPWRRRIAVAAIGLLLLVAALALAAWWLAGVRGGLAPARVEQAGPLASPPPMVRVIDGDTISYAGTTIRIADIDTPELRGRCAEEKALAAEAAARLETLLAEAPFEIAPAPDGRDEDRYGRKLRLLTRDGESLGGVLVEEGLARQWTGRREHWCAV